jgi:predicted AAA+ superfamily ATPase
MINRILKPPKQPFFLFGPRGTGKSTWVKNCFPNAVHVDLLNDGVYQEYSASPNRLLALVRGYPPQTPIVIDEVQKIPALLSLVHLLIEEDKSRQFILTGSSARKLKRAGVDLLGGRALLYHFHPFIARELGDDFSLENALKTGLVPLVWSAVEPSQTLKGYVGLYLREEVKMEGLVRNVEQFSQFLEVMAFSHGGLLNLNHVSREAQAKRATVDTYVSILEDLLLAFLVPPFTRRAKRAVTSHPKFYYFDAGVFQSLRRRGPFDPNPHVSRHPGESRGPVGKIAVDVRFNLWIPAFAGMTDLVKNASSRPVSYRSFWVIERLYAPPTFLRYSCRHGVYS